MEHTREYPAGGWPVLWSAVWVGALAAIVVGLVIGLLGYAAGAHELSTRPVNWTAMRWMSVLFSIGGAFFAFVAGGWAAGRIAGFRRAEPAMLHGAIAWLVAIPLLLVLGGLGGLGMYGGWFGPLLAGVPRNAAALAASPETAEALRNTAIMAGAAVLLGLVGSVLGGWMASGEPMRLGGYRRRLEFEDERPRRVA
jgi:hypothetical protein